MSDPFDESNDVASAIARQYARKQGAPSMTQFMGAQLLEAVPQFPLMIPQLPFALTTLGRIGLEKLGVDTGASGWNIEEWPIANAVRPYSEAVTRAVDEAVGLHDRGVDRTNIGSYDSTLEKAAYGANALIPFNAVKTVNRLLPTSAQLNPNSTVSSTIEAVFPTTAKYTAPRIAAQAGVPIGVQTLIENVHASTSDGNSIGPNIGRNGSSPDVLLADDVEDVFLPADDVQLQPEDSPSLADRYIDAARQHVEDNAAKYSIGLIAAAGVLGRKYFTRGLQNAGGGTNAPRGINDKFNRFHSDNPLTAVSKRLGEVTDDSKRVSNSVEQTTKTLFPPHRYPGSDEFAATIADAWDTKQAVSTRHSLNARVVNAMNDGTFVDSRLTTLPYTRFAEGIEQLTPQQQKLFNDALFAGDELDNFDLHGRTVTEYFAGKSRADLDAMYNAGLQDPVVGKFMRDARKILDDSLEYVGEQGGIKPSERLWLRVNRPHYAPRMPFQKTMERITDALTNASERTEQELEDAMNAVLFRRAEDQQLTNLRPFHMSIGDYLSTIQRKVAVNNLRKDFVDFLHGQSVIYNQRTGKNLPLVRKLRWRFDKKSGHIKTNARDPNAVITVRRDGKVQKYEVFDAGIARVMQYAPYAAQSIAGGALEATTRAGQRLLTGAVINPTLAPSLFLMDLGYASIFKNKQLAYGLIDEVLTRAFGQSPNIADPTALISSAGAAGYNMLSKSMLAFRSAIYRALDDPNTVLGLLRQGDKQGAAGVALNRVFDPMHSALKMVGDTQVGEHLLNRLADSMTKHYFRSVYHKLHAGGALSDRAFIIPEESYAGLIRDFAPHARGNVPVISGLYRVYRGIFDSIHTANQTALFAQNMKRMPQEQLVKESKLAAGGDYTRSGINPTYRLFTRGLTEFGNVTARATSHALHQVRKQPIQSAIGIISGVSVPILASRYLWQELGPEWADFYKTQIDDEQKGKYVILPPVEAVTNLYTGKPTDAIDKTKYISLRLAPEAAVGGLFAANVLDDLWGVSSDAMRTDRDIHAAVGSWLGVDPSPALQLPMAALGQNPDTARRITTALSGEDVPLTEVIQPSHRARGMNDMNKMYVNGVVNKNIYNITSSTVGVLARVIAEGLEAGNQATAEGLKNGFEGKNQVLDAPKSYAQAFLQGAGTAYLHGPVLPVRSLDPLEFGHSPVINQNNMKDIQRINRILEPLQMQKGILEGNLFEKLGFAAQLTGEQPGITPAPVQNEALAQGLLNLDALGSEVDDTRNILSSLMTHYETIRSMRLDSAERERRYRTIIPIINNVASQYIDLVRGFETRAGMSLEDLRKLPLQE